MQRMPKVINKKRLVRYKEGAEMYSMGMNKFQTLAKDAGAILKIDRMVLMTFKSAVCSSSFFSVIRNTFPILCF